MTNQPSLVRFLREGGIGKTLAKILPDAPWASYLLACRVFKRTYGFRPNVQRPRTLNEWLFARKVTLPRSVSFAPWVDKHLAKESVEKALVGLDATCHIAKTLHHSTNADDAFFSGELPRCVVKGTHGSGMNILIESPRRLTEEERASMREWLKTDYFWGSREPSYRHLVPSIIAEEFLPCDGLVPEDYKFFCFRGKVAFIQHDTGRYIDHRRCLYSPSWDRLPVTLAHDMYEHDAPAPQDLAAMIDIAQRLSERQNFVRVDLYQTQKGVYFGEMTFFPGSGLEVFQPINFDADVYQRWMMPGSEHGLAA